MPEQGKDFRDRHHVLELFGKEKGHQTSGGLSRHQGEAVLALQASFLFAAALCEISGSFLIFASVLRQEPNSTVLRLALGSVASTPAQPPSPSEVTAAQLNRRAMRRVAEYEQHAKDCRALAASSVRPDDKVVFEEIAKVWDKFAALRTLDLEERDEK